ncbi:biotin--[acetyl-CoA-carboxylase] ligase [Cryobacterium sp. TMT1-3]|uniref:biotin--[biotin carboxyl-carrier protein] ligase n=2 Tax=Microbacteriaceae TaxID=85023 RepID=A0A1H8CJ86_9MICO|nr:biotin--[acetyl-CoA-carboxylase] ligase [Cryobacterium luteum]TFC27501.1 biotin--[acetyl-CoA-carboxylase] ligase [Cryobacterium sp. TMT1-3]SEM94484.1 BirA family transcriptional regulator, biotin operon repressor / biotin-[acetyl-CoA-carboxylase] ligase [Cryobacterium luteum]
MEFSLSRAEVTRFEYRSEAASTNDVLKELATADAAAWPDLSVIVTDNQTQGRGRLGRVWLAPTGKALAISVLVRPQLPPASLGWFPLLAGAAMTRAVRKTVEASMQPVKDVKEAETPRHDTTLKWPNDVLIDGYKVCGILCELLPDGEGIIIGAGLNLSLDEHDLPTLTSTSLLLVTRTAPDPDQVLAAYLHELVTLYDAFVQANGDAQHDLHAAVTQLCGTLGSVVRVELPGGTDLVGTATGIDSEGRLQVVSQADGEQWSVAAGDVTHLRY